MPDPITALVVVGGGVAINEGSKNRKAAKEAAAKEEQRLKNLNAAVAAKETEYQGLADTYNSSVSAFNNSLSNAVSGLGGLSNSVGGLGIADLYDDPNTSANENQFTNLMGQLNSIENTLGGLSFNAQRPNFSSVISTDYGTGQISNIPTLSSANTGAIYDYQNTIDDLQSQLYGLNRERSNEVDRINRFYGDLEDDYSSVTRGLGRLDIRDMDMVDTYEDQLEGIMSSYRGFSSPILSQVGGYTSEQATNAYNDVMDDIAKLRSDRTAEEKRISDYGKLLDTNYTTYKNELSGYDIRNEDELNKLVGNLDSLYDEARDFDSILDYDFSGQENKLTGLYGDATQLLRDREDELDRLDDLDYQFGRDTKALDRFLGGLDISDLDYMNEVGFDIEDLRSQIGGVDSLLLDQVDFTDDTAALDTIGQNLTNLRNERTAEETRIANYLAGLQTFYDENDDELAGLNISNIDLMEAMRGEIEDKQKDARRFDSLLEFDFENALNDISDLDYNLDDLFFERDLELDRIDQAEKDYARQARAIDRLGDSTSIYNLANIEGLQSELDSLNDDITGFESLLDFDFSGTQENRTAAQADIERILSERSSALDEINAPISGYLQDLGGVELYDERGMNDIADLLDDRAFDLSRFSGGRVDEIGGNITDAVGQVDAKLQQLADYRAQLEEKAAAMQSNVEGSNYYGLGDLDTPQGEYDTLNSEIELYNASQAMDEIDAVMNRLYSERNRLEQDAENVAARKSTAQQALMDALSAFGLPEFDDLSQIDPMTMQQFLAAISNQEEEEEDFTLNPNAFSSNVIKLG
jgi:hypothetical protein